MDLTIIIPTMNRPEFLARQLNYYAGQRYSGHIVVSDSSNAESQEQVKAGINALHGRLSIEYLWTPPTKTHMAVVAACRDYIPTKYSVLVGDDDFLIPRALQPCIDFLEANEDYNFSCAHGRGLAIRLDQPGAYGKVTWADYYDLGRPVVDGGSASRRIKQYLSNFTTTLFYIHRTAQWKQMWEVTALMPDQTFGELLPSCMSAVFGKVKYLDVLYLVRQDHPKRYFGEGKYTWLANPDWESWYGLFTPTLAITVMQQDHITYTMAEQSVKTAFDGYMTGCLGRYWGDYRPNGHKDILGYARNLARKIPGLQTLATYAHNRHSAPSGNLSVYDELLSPRSPYCSDFVDVVEQCQDIRMMKCYTPDRD